MVDDIVFNSNEFFIELGLFSSGVVNSTIEWYGPNAFELKLKLPERVAIS